MELSSGIDVGLVGAQRSNVCHKSPSHSIDRAVQLSCRHPGPQSNRTTEPGHQEGHKRATEPQKKKKDMFPVGIDPTTLCVLGICSTI